jgi:hypothetical protein
MVLLSLGCAHFWPWAYVGVSEVGEGERNEVVGSWKVWAAATALLAGERTSDDTVGWSESIGKRSLDEEVPFVQSLRAGIVMLEECNGCG